jgi:glutamine cyclotransferase
MKIILEIFLLLLALSCKPSDRKSINNPLPGDRQLQKTRGSNIVEPAPDHRFTIGDPVTIRVAITDTSFSIDSVEFYVAGQKAAVAGVPPYQYIFDTKDMPVGHLDIRTNTCYSGAGNESNHVAVILLSDILPRDLSYTITHIFPHDINAYTQGLIYMEGWLYEGTGQYNESSLRKVDLVTGNPEHLLNLPGDIFGEGITIFNNKIYQLTYKSQVGFVYDKETFRRLHKVYYQNKEGWGLTHDGENLLMSDGSNVIYYMDPEYFTEVRRIEVYDNKGPVRELNELEYIRGKIFANIYGSEQIVIISPGTGKVTGRLNLSGILPEADRHRRIDVLNGIAWDQETGRIFVTGKYWPRLFELKLNAEP